MLTKDAINDGDKNTRWRRMLLIVVAVSVGLLILSAVVAPFWEFCQLQSRRNGFVAISLAVHAYHDDYGCFPPAVLRDPTGQPMHSWRVLILPYLAEYLHGDEVQVRRDLERYRFDEPWDSRHNSRLFHFGRLNSYASYLAIVGDGTVWPPSRTMSLQNVGDGTNQTIMLIEVRESDASFTEPRDIQLVGRTLFFTRSDGSPQEISFDRRRFACLCDGSIVYLPNEKDCPDAKQQIADMATADDGKPVESPF